MAKNRLSVKGTKNIHRHLKKSVTMNEVKNIVKLNTSEMQQKAQRHSPVDTGAMKRSITLSILEGGLTGRISPIMSYSPYVEWGTRFQTAQPFVKPAFNEQKNLFTQDLNRLMK